MRKILFLLLITIVAIPCYSQNVPAVSSPDKRFIEVTGTAEMEVVPDEIYINIILRERYEGKEKITLEKQDDSLKKKLTIIGIDLKSLSLSDAASDYVKIHWRKKDALNSKDYQLKVSTAEEVSKVFQALAELKINDANISKVDHSRMDDFKKELRIKAMKDAKDKATYMLAAIDEQVGKLVAVSEIKNFDHTVGDIESTSAGVFQREMNGVSVSGSRDYNNKYYVDGVPVYPEVVFQKIKLDYSVNARFEIK